VRGSMSGGGGYGPAPPNESWQNQQGQGRGYSAHNSQPFRHDAYRNPSAGYE
jgi:hypothetical protein